MDEIKLSCYHILMYSRTRPNRQPQAIKKNRARQGGYTLFSMSMLGLVITAILVGLKLFGPDEKQPVIKIAPPALAATPALNFVTNPQQIQANNAIRDPAKMLVGIVSGHKGYDPGAVCGDGLTEAQINYAVAVEVVDLLKRRGIQTDLLEEFDDRLTDYEADALVSIHADSCNVPGATGFKVARVTESAIPQAEDALVACLNQEYALYTGLPQHPASITDNMTDYHAFREIAPLTPGAIIETGFLLDDRYLLEQKPKIVARGIAAGVLCFLEGSTDFSP
jgi:N-acetylmuramoyl-L-alanine amidase